ncbi:SLK19 (YOR195W) [Zygosaccharomyces parabailii]|uniref:ZYBA0S10-03730g1_1 n=1 Tax=Zygosaccharomyces bailii (strain CLIB 213 / ATCC 58445 / CBS 680 / BCRC 21525 / NBRC 1098 / NCYC 1416 / NRRL Y-2227) TaxID=1333698 RepID=A0A8J2TA05_ZYGB2|nr:SLK19 (YOR195W) [Zygosaccharomyces parabailii]CDF91278.1 ZYBA0S10-03730g1_1 [Zygosaccharomyces bailii CLIB 213]CDH17049.1 uncharacterized protein ZBAI_08837 [Zygosaccharomyces bailii ISA1307]SJM88308.1 uncharacterized protein ZBIST_4497 [Zygosaccharomyces bailii]
MNSVPTTPGQISAGSQIEDRYPNTVGDDSKRLVHGLVNRRSSTQKNNSPLPRQTSPILDNMDVNRMFEQNKGLVKMNHSPIKIEFSSPDKPEDMGVYHGPVPKRLKLELALAPNLPQPSNEIETIEMIESRSSPRKESDQVEVSELQEAIRESKEDRDSITDISPSQERNGNISDLHRLTPVYNDDHDDRDEENAQVHNPDHDTFQMISSRNADLVDQIHELNRSINEVINSCDSTVSKYREEIQSLTHEYEAKLDAKAQERATVVQEREILQDRMQLLKRRLEETRDEVRMLSQNQSILKTKYEAATKEKEDYLNKLNELEEINLNLKSEATATGHKLDILESNYRNATTSVKKLEEEKDDLTESKNTAMEKLSALDKELAAKQDETNKLKALLDENLAAQQGSKDEKMRQIEELTRAKEDLESNLTLLQRRSVEEKESLELKLKACEKELNSVRQDAAMHKQNELDLKGKLDLKTEECQKWQASCEDINDDAEIRKAEAKELYSDLEEQKEMRIHLETSIVKLEEQVNDWRRKCDEYCNNYEKLALELESVHLKNSNIEAEHLAELEQLHDNLSSLQNTLKKDSELISQLTRKNETLESEKKYYHESQQNPPNLIALNKELRDWKDKYQEKELEANKSLKLLAEDLYIQYSSKHEQKVKLLKKGYETKFQGKLDKLLLQNEGLTQEVDQLKAQLTNERREKQKLIGLLESHTSPPTE